MFAGDVVQAQVDAAAQRPNIVFMLVDDQSWSGTSVQPHPDVPSDSGMPFRTPNLEQFAAESIRFSAAYAPAPVCAPSRASIATGRNPARLGWTTVAQPRTASTSQQLVPPDSRRALRDADVTIAAVLQQAGYQTAHFGKWHLGGGGPEAHGFDVSDGDLGNEAASQYTDPNPVDIFGMAKRAEQFMQRSRESDHPFFIQLSWLALHSPQNTLESTKLEYAEMPEIRGRQRNRLAITEDLDTGVGLVLDSIERLGLSENTYVIYMSDNGGDPSETAPLSGGKGGLQEGGIRVPLIIRGPGIEPNSWSHEPVIGYDLFPTFAEWAGINVQRDFDSALDGNSLASAASGRVDTVDRPLSGLVFHFPHYQGDYTPVSALVTEQYKLILNYESDSIALFDLKNDIGEEIDLAEELPTTALGFRNQLEQALQSLGAAMPSSNTAFDPTNVERLNQQPRAREREQRQRNRGDQDARPRGRGRGDIDGRQVDRGQIENNAEPTPPPEVTPSVSITIDNGFRVISANGLPSHDTGRFPNRHNPHSIGVQSHTYRMPLVPVMAESPIPSAGEFGIGVNGVIMDAGTGEFWTAESARVFGARSLWNYEALGGGINLGLDHHNAHVQGSGKYHYHGMPEGLIHSQSHELNRNFMIHIGWAFDGFPIYAGMGYSDPMDANSELQPLRSSYRLKEDERPDPPAGPGGRHDGTFGHDWEFIEALGDLDECNGRYGVTPEFPEGTYYYVITEEFPSIPRYWRATPDPSSLRQNRERRRTQPGGPSQDR